jgi:putative transposase
MVGGSKNLKGKVQQPVVNQGRRCAQKRETIASQGKLSLVASRNSPEQRLQSRGEASMANTYVRIIFHCIWSTKNRQMLISPDWEDSLWSYIGGVAGNHGIHPIQIGGIDNHIHAVVEPPKDMLLPSLIKILKNPSSHWINRTGRIDGKFNWQDGYGAFSVSPSLLPKVVHYVQRQRDHHLSKSFEEEYRDLMRWHGIEYDAAYLFG